MKRWPKRILVVTALILLFTLVPGVAADSTYVVRPGDNLFRIALNHGLSTYQLAQANGIVDVTRIYSGQILVIPDGSAGSVEEALEPAKPAKFIDAVAESTAATTTYIVRPGDHLYRIALSYGLSTYVVAQANGIVNLNHIYSGQVLTIPGAGSSSTSSASAVPAPAPAPVSYGDRWIDVNLSTQQLVAYEGNNPVYYATISSGTWLYPTVTGQFRIWIRHASQDMNGYRLGYDYYLPNVPYVMYFYGNYSLHGTYWHNNFGTPMSHGCVNMTIADAQWVYYWSDYGTQVNVHY